MRKLASGALALFLTATLGQAATAAAIGSWGVDLSDQDRSVKPGDDFAMFQNGSWFRRVQIGPQQPNAAYWRDLRIAANGSIDKLLSNLDSESGSVSHVHKLVRSFHRSAFDEATINARGLQPLNSEFSAIRAAKNRSAFARVMGAAEGPGTVRNISARLNLQARYKARNGSDRVDPARAMMLSAAASAQPAPMLDARTAQTIIAGCLADAQAKKNDQAIAVVDTGGRLIAALRFDGAPYGKMDFAEAKAVAAAAWGFDTAGQSDGAKDFPGFARAPFVQTVPGGVPVWSGRTRLGAVGVSGGAPADDVACAEAGLRAAGLSSSPMR